MNGRLQITRQLDQGWSGHMRWMSTARSTTLFATAECGNHVPKLLSHNQGIVLRDLGSPSFYASIPTAVHVLEDG